MSLSETALRPDDESDGKLEDDKGGAGAVAGAGSGSQSRISAMRRRLQGRFGRSRWDSSFGGRRRFESMMAGWLAGCVLSYQKPRRTRESGCQCRWPRVACLVQKQTTGTEGEMQAAARGWLWRGERETPSHWAQVEDNEEEEKKREME